MGLLASLFPLLRAGPSLQAQPLTAASIVEWLSGPATITGQRVSADTAMQISAVYSCVRVKSEDLASLPHILYRRLERGKERAPDHPLYRILHDQSNPQMTALQFRETMAAHLELRGNAFANIERNADGTVKWLWPLNPTRMDKPMLAADGRLLYRYWLPNGTQTVLTQDEVFHLRGMSFDGVWGLSPIEAQRETMGNAMAAMEYGTRFFANNANPSGVLQAKTRVSPEAAGRLKTSWNDAHQGLTNAHRVAILEEGMEWKQISITPEDAQYLESKKYSRSEIAGIYRVPAHKIGDLEHATFSNIEELDIDYAKSTIRPIARRYEAQTNMSLLLPSEQSRYLSEFLLDDLLRGKTLERFEAYQKAWWMTGNEIRERENLNPIEGLDQPLLPVNMALGAENLPDLNAQPAALPAGNARGMLKRITRTADGGYEVEEIDRA